MNVKLLLKVRDRVLREKRPVIMSAWFAVKRKDALKNWDSGIDIPWMMDKWVGISDQVDLIPSKEDGTGEHGCGTAGCIAGHTIIEVYGGRRFSKMRKVNGVWKDGKETNVNFVELAGSLLDLTEAQRFRLFQLNGWPLHFYDAYRQRQGEKGYKQLNKVVADRIEFFIKTKGL